MVSSNNSHFTEVNIDYIALNNVAVPFGLAGKMFYLEAIILLGNGGLAGVGISAWRLYVQI